MARAKSKKRGATVGADEQPDALAVTAANVRVASRAYDLYLARGCEHGYDVEDWLQAERELRNTADSTAA
jgi:hypothetical protein